MEFTEEKLEQAIINLLEEQGYDYIHGEKIDRNNTEVLIKDDLKNYLFKKYKANHITPAEIESIV
jgi:type I restriction enzyme, R subunit